MATIQLGRTRSASKLISYAEKRAEVREGVNCPVEYAKAQMKATRELWGKNEGIQAHHVIQSFKPGEVTPGVANEIGQELARELAKGHECAVYTHTDKDHIHNHIVINSVNYENGKKYQAHGDKAIENFRSASDRLCFERGLSVVTEPTALQRYDRAEYGLAKRGQISWKDEIREVIDHERKHSNSFEDFKKNLTEKYNIEVKDRGKTISFKHPDSQKFVRGKKLGLAYEKGMLENDFTRQIEGKSSEERRFTDLSNGTGHENDGTTEVVGGNERIKLVDEKLHQGSYGQRRNAPADDRSRTFKDQRNESGSATTNYFDMEKARQYAEGLRQSVAESYGEWQERDGREQSKNTSKNERDRAENQQQIERNEQSHDSKSKELRKQDFELDR